VDAGEVERRVARLACAGGKHVARTRARYAGLSTCRAAAVVSGGGKECAWGCLGLGDCVSVCASRAPSTLDAHGLPVVDVAKCTACNDCVLKCAPRRLFSLEPVQRRLWIACRNRADAEVAEAACEVACTACGKCVADAHAGLTDACTTTWSRSTTRTTRWPNAASRTAAPPAPSSGWTTQGLGLRGHAARKILRHDALPLRE
jgi:electron transport complex protein RnfB